jgi:translation initiation factor 3 subunit D
VGSSFNKRYNKLTKARWVQNGGRTGPRTLREGSVRVGPDWLQLEVFDLSQLGKLQTSPPEAKDLRWAGTLETYDEDFDRVTSKKPAKLRNYPNKQNRIVGAAADPIFEQLAEEDAGNVFVTDAVLSHLMASSRSVYPWDIVINFIGGTIFLDARSPQFFDIHSVDETSHQPPPEDDEENINGRVALSHEATIAHHDFTQTVSRNRRRLIDDVTAAELRAAFTATRGRNLRHDPC